MTNTRKKEKWSRVRQIGKRRVSEVLNGEVKIGLSEKVRVTQTLGSETVHLRELM